MNVQFLLLAKLKVCFSFHLIFPKSPSRKFYYLVRAVLQGYWMNYENPKHSRPSHMQQQLCKEEWEQCLFPLWATAGRSSKGHCNILVPAGSVYFLLISESEKSHNAVKNVGTQLLIISISSWTLNLMQPKVSEANTYFILGCFQIEDH